MSRLSAQCDELRAMAESVGLEVPQAATLMMEAVDTIWELRDDLQRANDAVQDAEHDESMAWDRVRKADAEADKLRELCADMYGFIKRMDEDCGDVTFSDCFDYCKHDTADDGCCKTGECWYEQRLRELGVEVEP